MWSWILSGAGLFALWLLGNKSYWGFIVGLLSDVLWGIYSYQTRQWGFIIACGIYAAMHVRNLVLWKKSGSE